MNFETLPKFPTHDEVDNSQIPSNGDGVELIWPPAAMLIAFSVTFCLGLVVTILVIRSIPPKVENPVEAYEGIGNYFDAMGRLALGAFVSMITGFFAAIAVGVWSERRIGRRTNG